MSVLSIKKLKFTIELGISRSNRQKIRRFIASRTKLEYLIIEGYPTTSLNVLPKNVKLPLKCLKVSNFVEIQINCPEFILNCRPYLERIEGKFSIETFRVLMNSLKLTEMTLSSSDWIDFEDIESLEANFSIQNLGIFEFNGEDDDLNALVQKFEALTSLEVYNPDYATAIQSSKIKTIKFFDCKTDVKYWNKLKLNFPNIESLELSGISADTTAEKLLISIADQKWKLKSLKLTDFTDISLDDLEYLLKSCSTLDTLMIPDDSVKWSLLRSEYQIKLFDHYIKKGLNILAISYKRNTTLHECREFLTQVTAAAE